MSEVELSKNHVVVQSGTEGPMAPSTSSRSWTRGEKVLASSTLFLLLSIGLSLVVFRGYLSLSPQNSLAVSVTSNFGSQDVCDTKECLEAAYRVIRSGDFGKDPCHDFYDYACFKWQAGNPLSSRQLYHAANSNLLRERVDQHIKKLLESGSNGSEDAINSRAVRSFYQSCVNFTSPNEEDLVSDLLGSLGGYQTSESWKESQLDLTNLTLQLLRVNGAPLFDVTLDIDPKDRSRYAVIIELPRPTSLVPNLFSSRSYEDHYAQVQLGEFSQLFNSAQPADILNLSSSSPELLDRHKLYKMIVDSLEEKKLLQLRSLIRKACRSLNVAETDVEADMSTISIVVSSIQKLMPSPRTRKFLKQQNRVYNEYTIERLQSQFESIDWRALLSGLMGFEGNVVNGGLWDWTEVKIYVPYPDYLRRLFSTVQYTDKRILHNMMLMIYARDMVVDLTEKEEEAGWTFCIQSTKSVFAMELSALFLRSFETSYLHSLRRDLNLIFRKVQESIIRFLGQANWLDQTTKDTAIRKIRTVEGHFLAPSFYLRDESFDETRKKIQMDPIDFYSNIRLVYCLFRKQLYQLILAQVDEERAIWAFVAFPFTVNAFYIQQFNSIVIPLAFLYQYSPGAPDYINYATIALTIAHESLHALDGSGSGFDPDGKLDDWWKDESRNHLGNKSACVAKQYSSFEKLIPFYEKRVPVQVDGNLTQNENIVDIAGLQVAYDAYKNQQKGIGRSDLKLPGLNFTLDQTFFLTAAQAYCANITPIGYVFLMETDEHTTNDFRINGMMMNFPKFAEAFQCPVGSDMNPQFRCTFW